MFKTPPVTISAESLLSLPIEALVDLYNRESKRLAGPLEAHTVDATCKPGYIIGRLARLPIYYQMRAETASNESASMLSRPITEEAERPQGRAESAREAAPLNGTKSFAILK